MVRELWVFILVQILVSKNLLPFSEVSESKTCQHLILSSVPKSHVLS